MRRAVLLLLSAVLVVASSTPQVAMAGGVPDPGQPGPYKAGFTTYVTTDASRSGGALFPAGRPIPMFVWYPVDPAAITPSTPEALYPWDPLALLGRPPVASSVYEEYGIDPAWQDPPASGAGPFPLVVLSPGWTDTPDFHISMGTRLASHGFVVAVPYHYGDGWYGESMDHVALAAANRTPDLSFVLTDLLARNQAAGNLLRGAINPEQAGASGHSLGGYAVMALAGGDDMVCDIFQDPYFVSLWGPPPPETCVPALPDARFKAILPLDGTNEFLSLRELSRVRVPAMGIGREWTTVGAHQARQHAAFSGHPNYRVDIKDSNHYVFADSCEWILVNRDLGYFDQPTFDFYWNFVCEGAIPFTEVHRLVNKYSVAFLKAVLAREPGYQDVLTPGHALTREPGVEFFVTERGSPQSIDGEWWPDRFIYFPHQPGSWKARAGTHP